MKIQGYEESLMGYREFVIHKQLQLIVPPVLLIVGTVGNLFSFWILMKTSRKASTYSFLCVLALMDFLVLYIGLFRLWMGHVIVDVAEINEPMCKIVQFLGYFSSDASVWVIVAVTIERSLVVTYPLKAQRLCNLRNARLSVAIIIAIFTIINSHFLWTVELTHFSYNNTIVSKCQAKPDYVYLLEYIWPWVDAGIYSFVPFILIIVLNSVIIKNVVTARKKRTFLRQHSSFTSSNGTRQQQEGVGGKRVTIMLLAVSFSFLITTLPMNIVLIYTSFADTTGDNEGHTIAKRKLVDTVAEMLMYTNHSINFFLYCATGRKFRNQFKSMICCCFCPKNSKRMTGGSKNLCKAHNTKDQYVIAGHNIGD